VLPRYHPASGPALRARPALVSRLRANPGGLLPPGIIRGSGAAPPVAAGGSHRRLLSPDRPGDWPRHRRPAQLHRPRSA